MHCLLLSYVVNDRPIHRNINGTNYYGFEMTICDKVKEFKGDNLTKYLSS
jgi:hypothetical protein